MSDQEIIAIVGSKVFHDLPAIKRKIKEIEPGKKILTGNLGAANEEVRRVVMERGDLALQVVSSAVYGEDKANEIIMEKCHRAIIFCGSSGRAFNLTTLARSLKKPFEAIHDVQEKVI